MATTKRTPFIRNVFTLRLASENSANTFILRFKPMHVILLLALIIGAAWFFAKDFGSDAAAANRRCEALRKSNRELEMHVEKLREEKNRLAGLVEMQNIELAERLREVEDTSSEVRSIIGLPSSAKASAKSKEHKRPALSSRSRLAREYVREDFSGFSDMKSEIEKNSKDIESLRKPAESHMKAVRRRNRLMSIIPCMKPSAGIITSPFGFRIHPVYGYSRFHSGIDIAEGCGTPIYAAASGRVTDACYMGGYGNAVVLSHGCGYSTLYGHCSSLCVSPGQTVRKGELIAYMGSTGVSTGPHLHYEVRINGACVDPSLYFEFSQKRLDNLIAKYGL